MASPFAPAEKLTSVPARQIAELRRLGEEAHSSSCSSCHKHLETAGAGLDSLEIAMPTSCWILSVIDAGGRVERCLRSFLAPTGNPKDSQWLYLWCLTFPSGGSVALLYFTQSMVMAEPNGNSMKQVLSTGNLLTAQSTRFHCAQS